MSTLAFIVGGVLPYLAVLVFLAGMIYRLNRWKRLPSRAG